MPNGKPAGVRCLHLSHDYRCELFGKPERPALCERFKPERWVCGDSQQQALTLLSALEQDSCSDSIS